MKRNLFVWLGLGGLTLALTAQGQMTSNQVAQVIAQAVTRAASVSTNSVIAVVDREGFVLGVWSVSGAGPPALDVQEAITKSGTAAFLSSDDHAFSTRTAGFIVQQNFPPMVRNRPPGPLVGVNFSSLSFSDVNRFKNPYTYMMGMFGGGGTNGGPIGGPAALSGLAGSPGGLPLYANGSLIGGVGVSGSTKGGQTGLPALDDIQAKQKKDLDEDVALAGQKGLAPFKSIHGKKVSIDGLRLPYKKGGARLKLNAVLPLGTVGVPVPPYFITNSPPVSYPATNLGGVTGEVRAPIMADPLPGTLNGQARLSAAEVTSILTLAAQRSVITRAGIRLPRGRKAARVFISVVNYPNAAGTTPVVLGTFRTTDATIFSWDVSVQKARTALYYSSNTNAFSTRTIGFLAQSRYPPGIKGKPPGPLYGMQELFSLLPCGITNTLNGVVITAGCLLSPDPNLPNGITIFPGGFPLYRNGQLIGAIGISGDGVDQDDIIGASGTVGFQPSTGIRADHMMFRNTRLPYAKFPRNPKL